MAKQKTEIEEAVVVEETTDVLVATEELKSSFPTIPKKFVTEKYGEHSVAVAEKLKTEIETQVKKIKGFDDTKGWEKLQELTTKAQKGRTLLEGERKKVVAPWLKFTKDLKSATDEVGDKFKEAEDIGDNKLNELKNWEAEQERIEAERIAKRTEQRKEDLRAMGGLYDVESGTFTFPYSDITFNAIQLETWDDEDWGQEKDAVSIDYAEEQKRIADEEAEKAAKEAEVLAKEKALADKQLAMRAKELKLEGFAFDEGLQSYTKNDVVIHVLAVKSMSDEDWDAEIERANMEAVEVPEEESEVNTPGINLPPSDDSAEASTEEETPFDPIASIIEEKVAAHVEHQEEVDGVVRVTLEFSNDQPYIDVPFKNTFIRMFPESLDDRATVRLASDKISAKGTHAESGLVLLAVKK